jgi:hypothetical protein
VYHANIQLTLHRAHFTGEFQLSDFLPDAEPAQQRPEDKVAVFRAMIEASRANRQAAGVVYSDKPPVDVSVVIPDEIKELV